MMKRIIMALCMGLVLTLVPSTVSAQMKLDIGGGSHSSSSHKSSTTKHKSEVKVKKVKEKAESSHRSHHHSSDSDENTEVPVTTKTVDVAYDGDYDNGMFFLPDGAGVPTSTSQKYASAEALPTVAVQNAPATVQVPPVKDIPAKETPSVVETRTSNPDNGGSVIVKTTTQKDDNAIVTTTTTTTREEKYAVYNYVDRQPQFPGGEDALNRFIASHLRIPAGAPSGEVGVKMVITRTGMVGDVLVKRSLNDECDAEAVRLMKSLPAFSPARKNDEAVNSWYELSIPFKK